MEKKQGNKKDGRERISKDCELAVKWEELKFYEILVPNNILKAIVEMRDHDLLPPRVDSLGSSTAHTLCCHLYQHVELLDGHLVRKQNNMRSELENNM